MTNIDCVELTSVLMNVVMSWNVLMRMPGASPKSRILESDGDRTVIELFCPSWELRRVFCACGTSHRFSSSGSEWVCGPSSKKFFDCSKSVVRN